MKCSLGISNFLEEISTLSYSIVFLYFFALITEEGFHISPGYSLELCIQMGISFLFSFAFHFKTPKIELPQDPANPLPNIYTDKTIIQKDTCIPMFTAALYTIIRTWKQPKHPSTEEWIMKMWFIYIMECYSTIKKNETGSLVKTWRDPETVIENAIKQKDKSKYHILKHIYGIWKNYYRQSYLQSINRDTDVEKKCVDTKWWKGGWGNWETGIYIRFTLLFSH